MILHASPSAFGRSVDRPILGRRVVILAGLLAVLLMAASCRAPQPPSSTPAPQLAADEAGLAAGLRELRPMVDPAEAARAAQITVRTIEDAAHTNRLRGGARRRNVAINLGLENWGLCWHWTELLGQRLRDADLRTLEIHWACAHPGSTLREHNAVVMTARGQAFADGLVIDPWRRGGRLTWIPVAEDRYPWNHDAAAEARWK
jgi:hypothetical protein